MKKEFEKDLGQDVWIMHENKPICVKISGIKYSKILDCVTFDKINEFESYQLSIVETRKSIGWFNKECVFDTKEDLIESL